MGGGSVILASASAARRALLEASGVPFTVVTGGFDEAAAKASGRALGETPARLAQRLAEGKAREVSVAAPEALVVGADQILVCEGRYFDKPADLAAARTQLAALRGRWHALVTAVVCLRAGETLWAHVETPHLRMRAFSDLVLDAHLEAEGDRVLTTVGAYRLEGRGIQLFAEVAGDHAAILGLPLLPLLGFFRRVGCLPE